MIGMAQDATDSEEVDTSVDHEGRSRVAQVVDAEVVNPRFPSRRIERMLEVRVGLLRPRVCQHELAIPQSRQAFDNADSLTRQRNMPSLASLALRNEPSSPIEIDMIPLGLQKFSLSSSGQ